MLRDSPRFPVRLVVAVAAGIALPGCYYVHLAAGQLEMNRRREPIEEVIARPGHRRNAARPGSSSRRARAISR